MSSQKHPIPLSLFGLLATICLVGLLGCETATTEPTDNGQQPPPDVGNDVTFPDTQIPDQDNPQPDVPENDQTCKPDCGGKACGDDGCGGSCGSCPDNYNCDVFGQCICQPNCLGKDCGDDGCGGSCGTCTDPDVCTDGQCIPPGCTDTGCAGRECGLAPNQTDCPGVSCGECVATQFCQADGTCGDVCTGSCENKECGDDGCAPFNESECGVCDDGAVCTDGVCEVCVPDCTGKICGTDGCGGTCGACPDGTQCSDDGTTCVGEQQVGTCRQFYECQYACPGADVGCIADCEGQLSEDGLSRKAAFQECQQTNCGTCQDNDCLNQCIDEFCTDEYLQCFHKYGWRTCSQLDDCLGACASDDEDCASNCQTETGVDGMREFFAIISCMRATCNPDELTDEEFQICANGAAWDECAAESEACYGAGDLTCREILGCQNDCDSAPDSSACANECMDQGSVAGKREIYDLIGCISVACGDEWTEECLTQVQGEGGACYATLQGCEGPSGDDTCLQILQCGNDCEDSACLMDCLGNGTTEAQDQYFALNDCIFATCGDSPSAQCQQEAQQEGGACYDELSTCVGPLPTGDDTCLQVLQCGNNCEDLACLQDCLGNGTEEAQQQYQALSNCIFDTCGDSPTAQCQQEAQQEGGACADELDACTGSAPPPVGTDTCYEVLQCGNSCQDSACLQTCLANGTAEAQQQYIALSNCIIDTCGQQPTQECMTTAQQAGGACVDELQTCVGGTTPTTGTDTCTEVLQCAATCQDMTCLQACVEAGTEEAQQQFIAVNDCIIETCGEQPTTQCQTQAQQTGGACYDELQTCLGSAPAAKSAQMVGSLQIRSPLFVSQIRWLEPDMAWMAGSLSTLVRQPVLLAAKHLQMVQPLDWMLGRLLP